MKKTQNNQIGNADIDSIWGVIIIAAILWFSGFNFGITSEGMVTYKDCRQIITLQNDSWQKYFHSFVCNNIKTQSGKIMGGECVAVISDSYFFGNSHTCAKAYVYNQNPSGGICTDTRYPYLSYNDQCQPKPDLNTWLQEAKNEPGNKNFSDQQLITYYNEKYKSVNQVNNNWVKVLAPDGRIGSIPIANLDKALKAGYIKIQ